MKKVILLGFLVLIAGAPGGPLEASRRQVVTEYPRTALEPLQAFQDVGIEGFRYLPPQRFSKWVYKYCAEQGVAVDAVCRLAWGESRWDPRATNVNRKGRGVDRGLFQPNSLSWAEMCMEFNNGGRLGNAFDPETNVRVCIRKFAAILKRTGSLRQAYAVWNAGPQGALNPPQKTLEFVRLLMKS